MICPKCKGDLSYFKSHRYLEQGEAVLDCNCGERIYPKPKEIKMDKEKNKYKEEKKLLLKWYKNRSKMKYKDEKLRVSEKGLRAMINALEEYKTKNKFNEEYTQFLEDLRTEMTFILCEEYLI
jgi:uncharacterized protein YbaR (Trm112 family)